MLESQGNKQKAEYTMADHTIGVQRRHMCSHMGAHHDNKHCEGPSMRDVRRPATIKHVEKAVYVV